MKQTAGLGGTPALVPSSHQGGIPELDGELKEVLPRPGVCPCSSRRCWQCLLPLLTEEPPVTNQYAELGLNYAVMTLVIVTYNVVMITGE